MRRSVRAHNFSRPTARGTRPAFRASRETNSTAPRWANRCRVQEVDAAPEAASQ
jgi:hypothetical protein